MTVVDPYSLKTQTLSSVSLPMESTRTVLELVVVTALILLMILHGSMNISRYDLSCLLIVFRTRSISDYVMAFGIRTFTTVRTVEVVYTL